MASDKTDNNGDDIADQFTTYTYDANGKLTFADIDKNGDGTIALMSKIWFYEVSQYETLDL